MALVRGGITVKPHVQALANALEAEFGVTSFGTYHGHSPPEGPTQALDVFTPDNTAGYALQDRICAFVRANARRFGVRYQIRRAQIWNIERDGEDWRNQGRTGNRVADHMEHVHITCYATAPGPFGPSGPPQPQPPPQQEDDDMPIFGDAPPERPDQAGLWIMWGGFRKRVHTPQVWDDYRALGAKMVPGGKFPLALFDATINIEAALAAKVVVTTDGGAIDYPKVAKAVADEMYGRLAG